MGRSFATRLSGVILTCVHCSCLLWAALQRRRRRQRQKQRVKSRLILVLS